MKKVQTFRDCLKSLAGGIVCFALGYRVAMESNGEFNALMFLGIALCMAATTFFVSIPVLIIIGFGRKGLAIGGLALCFFSIVAGIVWSLGPPGVK
ncbi:MAG: hypothetical protein AB7W16_24150 [Candidatus Obscuribacterales bacterium]